MDKVFISDAATSLLWAIPGVKEVQESWDEDGVVYHVCGDTRISREILESIAEELMSIYKAYSPRVETMRCGSYLGETLLDPRGVGD